MGKSFFAKIQPRNFELEKLFMIQISCPNSETNDIKEETIQKGISLKKFVINLSAIYDDVRCST